MSLSLVLTSVENERPRPFTKAFFLNHGLADLSPGLRDTETCLLSDFLERLHERRHDEALRARWASEMHYNIVVATQAAGEIHRELYIWFSS